MIHLVVARRIYCDDMHQSGKGLDAGPAVPSSEVAPERVAWLESERPEKVPEVVARRILRDIVRQGLVAGDMLPPEAVMIEQLGIGRASLREALRILETRGIVRIKPGPRGGPMVDEVTAADYGRTMTVFLHASGATFRELMEARLIMEPVLARLAATRLTEEGAARIRGAITAGWDAVDEPSEVWSAASEEFHAAVAAGSGSRVLDIFSGSLMSIHRSRIGSMFPVNQRRATCRIHDRIAAAVLDRNAAGAEQLTRKHIEAVVQVVQQGMLQQMDEVVDWR
jgi:DNA-binding FadR family transcriptional regulator